MKAVERHGVGWQWQRNIALFNDRQSGLTYWETGLRYGVTPERARQVCMRIERDRRRVEGKLQDLVVRMKECGY